MIDFKRPDDCKAFLFPCRSVCPHTRELRGTCDRQTCLVTVQTTQATLEDCKCVERQSIRNETCCCPKPEVTEDCLENSTLLVQKRINYQFNPEKKSCEATTQVVKRPLGTLDFRTIGSLPTLLISF